MSYNGHVEKGVVVFDGPLKPPEGTIVLVQVVNNRKVGEGLARLAGKAKTLPADFGDRHDHYKKERFSS
jgi:hypothetical protein